MEEEKKLLKDSSDSSDFYSSDNQYHQRTSVQQRNQQQDAGGYLTTIDEEQFETRVDDEKQKDVDKVILVYTILLVIHTLMIITVVLLFFLNEPFQKALTQFFFEFQEITFRNLLVLFWIGVCVKVSGFPISIFELFVSYVQQNYWASVCLLVFSKVTGCYISYLISKYFFAKNVQVWMQTQKQLKVFGIAAEKNPWKVSFLVRFLWLPIFIKNYGIGLFKISSIQFLIPAFFQCFMKSAFICFVGINLKNFYDILKGETLADNIYLKIAGIVVSLILFGILFYICKKQYEQLENEVMEEDKQRKRSSVNSDYTNVLKQADQ